MEDTEKPDSDPAPTNDDAPLSQGKSCALCGCATPAVRCDRCNSQIFCLSCDDMYHRHPKRKLHLRKAVDSIWSTARSPRLRRRTDLPGDPCKIPIPPPRSKKRERHTIGGRIFLKSGLELGSFGHSKVFDPKNLPTSKDFFIEQKSPASMVESNCDDETSNPRVRSATGQIYENDGVANPTGNLDENLNDRSPWNPMRPNISSPIQVSIPSSSPDIVANGQAFGYPAKPHSQSAADLTGQAGHPVGHHPYHFHPPYPYMHPQMHPYSHSMAHLNCAQCLSSSSWSNLISPHPSPYFHPMPWGSAQNTMSRHPVPGQPSLMKHSHGDLPSYPDSNFHYPYHGGGYYPNGPPAVDPNFIKDLHEQAEMQKLKKEVMGSKPSPNPGNEEMDTTTNPASIENEPSAVTSPEAGASANQDAEEEMPVAPEKPNEPWSCVHCTFINPAGIYICQVCCKTSYGNKGSRAKDEQSEISSHTRDSESPLINRDALLNTPEVSGFRDAQKDDDTQMEEQFSEMESKEQITSNEISDPIAKFTTETQTSTTTKTTDAQTQNILFQSIASSTDSIFPKQEISVQTEVEATIQNISVATDPMISSQSLESLLSGVSAPPYHNRRAGWGRGATSFSTQSLYERGRSRSPMPRSLSFHTEAPNLGRDSSFASEEAVHSASQAWLYTDPMYFKPHNQGLTKEDYFDGTWGSMDRLNRRVQHKKDKGKLEHVRPKLHRSLDDLKSDKRPEIVHTQELMMLQTVKEAERCGFNLEDLHVAYLHCGKENPVYWLEDNWPSLIKNVIALAAKYGEDNEENDVGVITSTEAKEALHIHRGDIWDAVAECIENRQRKILELTVRGNFTQKQISEALKNNEGNVELAYADLLRASTRRHKFILSPGLSTDSEDLNIYNPVEDSAVDHNISVSPMKSAKLEVSTESKTEKKKSDFLTKLTAIREAQSERRKAREEKELIRETITQDFPVESETAVKEKDISVELTPSISREESKEVEETVQDTLPESTVEVETDSKSEIEVSAMNKTVPNVKEGTEDNIPVDFDTNWSESQGEWIEEYSDEQWEEGDEHWVGLGKKFQKMEKEFEEEAMQMAALWEKEELEDDVFEDESKVQQEAEVIADNDKKFDDWVKANLKVDSSEYEEEVETKGKNLDEDIVSISMRERLELEGSQSSPLQHYPTALDLSLKSQFESDWVDLPADAEIEKLAHDIVCEGSDIENKLDEAEMVMYEEEKVRKFSDQGSDGDWEKIEMDEQLQEINELDRFAFPDKEGEIEKSVEEFDQRVFDEKYNELMSDITDQITIDRDKTVLYKNLEILSAVDSSDIGVSADSVPETTGRISVSDSGREPFIDEDQPRPPVRRKSKLNSAAIEQALKNQAVTDTSSVPDDIPPVLPEKTKYKDSQQKMLDVYAIPDKTHKTENLVSKETDVKSIPSVPQKPPRLNLSPLPSEENIVLKDGEEKEPELPRRILSKDGSPVTPLSYESDSNFFADSESDTETKLHRQKNIHRKPAKYENEIEDTEMDTISREKLTKLAVDEKSDILDSNFDFELDDDIDPALIEPLPRMKDIDFDPELPILLGGRGRQVSDLDDVNAPKAFREDTARPLQLFKATKRETPTSTLNRSSPVVPECPVTEAVFSEMADEGLPLPIGTPFDTPTKLPEPTNYENQAIESYYYNEAVIPQQSLNETQLIDKVETIEQMPEESINKLETEQEIEQAFQPISAVKTEDEIAFTEMEGLSAAVDYFFGQYNEITVTHPKKKVPARAKAAGTVTDKPSTPSKAMSTSEITSIPKTEASSQMELSAAAILQEGPLPESVPSTSDLQSNITNVNINKQPAAPLIISKEVLSPEKQKQSAPTECLSFAEDYLFGCYNQVVVPRKTKNKPVVLATIPKLGEASQLLRTQSPHTEQKPSAPTPEPTPEPTELLEEEPEEEELEEVPEGDENVIPSESSVVYDEVFHDLPPEMLANQSFDESSIYYESFQDAVENMQDTPSVGGNVVNVRPKTVHFEESTAPVVPPRKHKPQNTQKAKAPISPVSSESYANEYLFRQYEQVSQAKKKLPVCSEDFRMKQGFEPPEIPHDIPLMPDEQHEGVLSSEISNEIPSKSIESFKYSSEYEFRDSEQSLDLVKQDSIMNEMTATTISAIESQSAVLSEDNLVSVTHPSEIVSCDTRQDVIMNIDIQSEKSESFEELSIPDQPEKIVDSSLVSSELNIEEKDKREIIPDELSETVTNIHSSHSYDEKPLEQSVSSSALEMDDQFVFIDQTQDIIDDSYNLYDIQESLACNLNYVDVKGNIEDECTDDSEQEWKRNEDRKNTLNASFLNTAPGTCAEDKEVTVMDNSKTEELNFEDSERKSISDQNDLDLELIEISKEEGKFLELSEDISSDNQNIVAEEFGEISEVIGRADTNFEQTISSTVDKSEIMSESESIDIKENIISKEIAEDSAEIDHGETISSVTSEAHIVSESAEKMTEVIAKTVSEIDQDFKQKSSLIDEVQMTSESISSEISGKIDHDLEENICSVASEAQIMSESARKMTKVIAESTAEIDEVQMMSENISTEVSEEIVLQDITESVPDKEHLEQHDVDEVNVDSEESNLISSISEVDNLFITEENYLKSSDEAEIEAELSVTAEDLTLFEDQQIDMLEDFEATGEMSDDNASTHSSVSTQIAVSMKIGLKESEGDECSLNFEQNEYLDDDNEVPVSLSISAATTEKFQGDRENILEYDAECEDFDKFEKTYETEAEEHLDYLEFESKIEHEENKAQLTPTPSFEYESQIDKSVPEIDFEDESVIKETLKEDIESSEIFLEESVLDEEVSVSYCDQEEMAKITHGIASELQTEEFLQTSFDQNIDQFLLEKSSYSDVFEEKKVKDGDVIDTVANNVDEFTEEETIIPVQDDLYAENANVLAEVSVIDDNETKLSEPQDEEIESESLMSEEPIIMSHFYDEWYQNVESSAKFTLLSAESIYAKYGSAESSESGNESDNDNVLSGEFTEKDSKRFDYNTEELPLEKSVSDEVELYSMNAISEKLKMDETEIKNEDEISFKYSDEQKMEFMQHDQQVSESNIAEESIVSEKTQISSFIPESIKTVSIYTEHEDSVQFDKNQEISDTKSVKSKFSTSKSCQTEDSFEEDIFFDSFDDTFTIPSYIHLPIETQTKPPTSDISIQCELISNEDILSSKKELSSALQTQAVISLPETSEELHLRGEQPKQSELASEEKEESSCESFEDSDSDIFIESPSSQDELDVGARRGLLYAEVDSDTGFSSGSECGWTKKKDFKQKESKKTSESSVTKIHSQQISTVVLSTGNEIVSSTETCLVPTDVACDEIEGKLIETHSISEQDMATENQEKECIETIPSDARASPLPLEIIERAVTPVAIPQFPSFEDDLVFIEVQENIEEITDDKQEEFISTTPTVEYFYGPLPETIKIESPPDLSERFFETTSEFSESVSFSCDRTESFSDSVSSIPLVEQISSESVAEDESFAETNSSLKGEIDDSISEYYSIPESTVSFASRASLAESDIFDFAQSEVFADNGFIVAEDFSSSDNKNKDEKISDDKLQLSLSEITKSSSVIKTLESSDNQLQDIATNEIKSASEKTVELSDISTKIQSEIELRDQVLQVGTQVISPKRSDAAATELQETVSEGHVPEAKSIETMNEKEPVDSSFESSVDVPVSESVKCEPLISDLIVSSSDVPPVPSDIIRYLYYDDSITFDDESYHTQSENLEASSIASEEIQPTVETKQFSASDNEICMPPSSESFSPVEDKLTPQVLDVSIDKTTVSSGELIESSTEIAAQECHSPTVPELLPSEVVLSTTDVKMSDNVLELAAEPTIKPESSLSNDDPHSSETELKFPTVEVIASENVSVLPVTTEQIHETIVHIDEQISESASFADIPFEDVSNLPEESEFQDVAPAVLKHTSPEIPHVPSDIIRYLYYADDITFDESTQNSFHSQSDNISDSGAENLQPELNVNEFSDIKPSIMEYEEDNMKISSDLQEETKLELPLELKVDTSDISHEESSYKPDSSSAKDKSLPPFDSSECIENWFDLEETNGKKKHHDSEQYSSTKSSALKDSEQPCIPEYILSPKLDDNVPAGKTDVDEVTDISTHFTMTDDSDRFSDIESDTSLNFEDECILPVEVSDQIAEIYEGNEDDEMNLCTPEVKDMPGGFRFLTAEHLEKEFIELHIPEESLEQEKYDECVTSNDFSEQQFAECLTSSELPEQEILIEHSEVPQEKLNENVTFTDFCETSKQVAEYSASNELSDQLGGIIKHLEKDSKEEFDECIISNDFSGVSEEQFIECLTSGELSDQQFGKEIMQEHSEEILKEKFSECIASSEISKEQFTECVTLSELPDQLASQDIIHVEQELKEEFDECVTSTDFSEVSKEQFVECVTLGESHDHLTECSTLSKLPELASQEIIHDHVEQETKEEFDECITSTDISEVSKDQFVECLTSGESLDHLTCKQTVCEDAARETKNESEEYITSSDLSERYKEQFSECLISSEFPDKQPDKEVLHEHIKEKTDENISSELSEVSKDLFSECLTSSELLDQKESGVTASFEVLQEHSDKETIDKVPENLAFDENGNFPEPGVKYSVFHSEEAEPYNLLEDLKISSKIETCESPLTDKEDFSGPSQEGHSISVEQSFVISEEEKICTYEKVGPCLQQTEAATPFHKDDDLEESCYTLPSEDSHSISTEITDNWSDAESKNIEVDESIYDVPLENVNNIQSDINIETGVAKLTGIKTDFVDSYESFISETISTDTISSECQKEEDIKIIKTLETVDIKSDVTETTDNLSNKFISYSETEKSETDSFDSCKIHEACTGEEIIESSDDKTYENCIPVSTEQVSKQPSVFIDNLLSSDVRHISEIKMETGSEISSAMKKEVHIECMSAASGEEPTFSFSGTMYDTQEVQIEEKSSKELCSSEEVITGVLFPSESSEDTSETKVLPDAIMEEMQLSSDVDIFESPTFNVIEAKYVDISGLEPKYIKYTSFSKSAESDKAKISDFPCVVEKKDLTLISVSEDKTAEALNVKSTEQYIPQNEVVDTISTQSSTVKDYSSAVKDNIQHDEICKELEVVDFKGQLSTDSITSETEIGLTETVTVSTDKIIQVTEQVNFKLMPEDIDSISNKIIEEKFTETKEECVDFRGQFGEYDKKDKLKTSEVSSKTDDHQVFSDATKKVVVHKTFDSSEVIDFKGSFTQGEDQISMQVKDAIPSKHSDSKSVEQKSDNIQLENVDFKGEFTINDSKVNLKGEEVAITAKSSYEVIAEPKTEKEFVDFKSTDSQEKFKESRVEDANIKLDVKSISETVNFKGQLPVKDVPSVTEAKSEFTEKQEIAIIEKKLEKSSELEKVDMQSKIEGSSKFVFGKSTVESNIELRTVDFKGLLTSDKLKIQEEYNIQSDPVTINDTVKPKEENEVIKLDQIAETIDFKGIIYPSYSETGKQEKELDIASMSVADIQTDSVVYDTQTAEIYGYNISDQAVTYDANEIYKYGIDEQAVTYMSQEMYGYSTNDEALTYMPQETSGYSTNDEALTYMPQEASGYSTEELDVAFESQQNIYHDEMIASDSISYGISVEDSNELYSCVESLSGAEDTPSQFYSISDDLEDTLNVTTSEEFTDVPSHLTSTESSDKWSDVEGEFSFEDVEFDRDKTPTRTQEDIMITQKDKLKEVATDIQISETKTVSKAIEIKDDNMINLDNKKTVITADTGISDLNVVIKKDDSNTDLHKFGTLSDLRDVIDEETNSFTPKETLKAKESEKQTNIMEDTSEKISEIPVAASDKNSDIEVSTISQELEMKLPELSATQSIYEEVSCDDYLLKAESADKLEICIDQEILSANSTDLPQTTEDVELFSAKESTDFSLITASDDYQFSAETSEKWSDVESEIELLEKDSKLSDIIPDVFDDFKEPEAIHTERDDNEVPLTEHFADIKSLKEQLTTVDIFSSHDAETAVSITHEDTSTDISSQFEKTESDLWLEAETEHSASEVGEDIAFSVEKDGETKVVFVEYEKIVEEIDTAIQSSETPYASTTSTSSSYSDFENSDQTSDTCADISLQGATTENSDKWSDIEAEGLIDDVLYGTVDTTENVELADFSQLMKKCEESIDTGKITSSEDQIKILQTSFEATTEVSASPDVEMKSKIEEIQTVTENKSDLVKTPESSSSFEHPDSTSVNVTSFAQSSVLTESSSIVSPTSSIMTTTGTSDDELTNVTPLETEESDKWSDISGDTSLEEIDDESSTSLKPSLKLKVQDSVAFSNESEVDVKRKAKIEESKDISVKSDMHKSDDFTKMCEESSTSLKTNLKSQERESEEVSTEVIIDITKELSSTIAKDSEKCELKPKANDSFEETATIYHATDKMEEKQLQFVEEQVNTDESLSMKAKTIEESPPLSDSSFTVDSKILKTSVEQTGASKILSDEESLVSFKADFKVQDQDSAVSGESNLLKEEISSVISEESKCRLASESPAEIEEVKIKETIESKQFETTQTISKEAMESCVEEKIEIEDSSSSKITDEYETLDNFTDVPTHTLTSETSDAYCELDSDHSFEEIESPQVEEDIEMQDIQQTVDIVGQNIQQTGDITAQNISEYYENSLANEELLENDDYALDAIPENELEHYELEEEEEYSLSEHFEINEDELIYPLPYNDDWIEQSFELKEYGVEAVFSESGSDIHGLGIANEEYDDEDIQRAIDYNLSTFEENEDNIENVGATESFKTISNDASPHLKPEEFDTWSTADAPSIEEEFGEQDNILSKIDELLSEDFGDLDTYQADSPLEHHDDYLLRDISTPDETYYKDFIQIDNDSLPKDTSLQIDKSHEATEFETVLNRKEDSEVLMRESDTVSDGKVIKKDSADAFKIESKGTVDEITIKKDSGLETECSDQTAEKDSEKAFRIESETVSRKITVKKDATEVKTDSEVVSGEMKKDFAQILETDSGTKTIANDSIEVPGIFETVSDKITTEINIEKALKPEYDSSLEKDSVLVLKPTKEILGESEISDISEISSCQSKTFTSISEALSEETETASVLSDEKKALNKNIFSSSEAATSFPLPSDELTERIEVVQTTIIKNEQDSSVDVDISSKVKSSIESSVTSDQSSDFVSISEDASTTVLSSTDFSKQIEDKLSDSVTLSVSETDSSFDIPSKKLSKSTESYDEFSIKFKKPIESSENTESIQDSQQLSKPLKHSITSAADSVDIQLNIPDQRVYKDETCSATEKSISLTPDLSKEETSADSLVVEIKPDIPKKTKRRSLDSKEGTPIKDESDKKPSLPPKKSKRRSVSDSPSSSFGESLSSSSSVESLGSFESAVSDKSRKSSLKSSDETSMHSMSPEVPARRSRSSKMSSSSRSTSRDSDDSSAPSRSSSLKIRRRSSNFIEPEPIDFSKRRASIDERMRKLQNEGKCTTKEKAFIAAKLIEMQFEEEDALLASRQCNTVYHAVKFLTQLCEMCNCRFPINLMSSMVHCAHRACRECLRAHFTSLLYDRSVFTLLCPICHKPDITDQNIQEYFTHLDMTLRNILEEKVYDLFQRKLRDEVLTKDPNFHWCSQCSSGFIASPRLKKLYCPDCSAITCALCHQTWEIEHEGVHCERFQQWKDMHTPEPPPAGLVKFLIDRGIGCPSCGLVYAQACGGCMMYKCSHCSFEFCGFCIQPLKRGRDCSNEICDSRGLHIHHLHNCLFFLRDKDITEIQMLLEEESVTYLTIPPKDQIVKSRCQVREQKYAHGVITEDRCGRDIEPYCGGLCRTHYYEYLAELLRKKNISPLSIMTIQDLQFMLRKSRVLVPEKVKGESGEDYYERLLNLVTTTLT